MFNVTLNLVTISTTLFLLLSGFSLGYFFRSAKNYRFKKRILELEQEMVQNHAEILSLVKAKPDTGRDKNLNTPVITLNSNGNGRVQENMSAK